mgnify:CR=1 FL=1
MGSRQRLLALAIPLLALGGRRERERFLLKLGECYMDGSLDVTGGTTIYEALALLADNAQAAPPSHPAARRTLGRAGGTHLGAAALAVV